MACPWILLLPIHNAAYVGILGNVALHEAELKSDLDMSVWNAMVWVGLGVSVVCWYFTRNKIALAFICFFVALAYIIGTQIHYCLFKLYSRHPGLVSMIWFMPGVVFWQARVAEKRLDAECKELEEEMHES